MQVLIVVQPFKWLVNIQTPGPVSVSQVVQHICEYLQGYNSPQDVQRSKMIPIGGYPQSDRFREQQNHLNGFHSGQRCIDLLGWCRVFCGLSPEPGYQSTWVVVRF